MVDAVKTKHPDVFDADFRPRDEHRDELEKHGIQSHGVVCVDASGQTLWKHGDHMMTQKQLDEGLATVLGKLGR